MGEKAEKRAGKQVDSELGEGSREQLRPSRLVQDCGEKSK